MNRQVTADKIKLLVLDVDGTLTDSGVYYDDNGNELKKFSTKDGTGFNIAHDAGMEIIVITGRACNATKKRLEELKTDYIYQGVQKKALFLKDFMQEKGLTSENVGYIGDDLNDIPAMRMCGYVGCPADAAKEVKEIADYVSNIKCGHGAMRDCVENLLVIRGDRDEIIQKTIARYE